jgi:hypothetical protein
MFSRGRFWAVVWVAAMTALVAIFFREGLFGKDLTLIWDGADYHFPNLNLVSRLWRSGHLPLWNPFLFNGYPLIAQPHYQVFYPPNLLLTLATAFTPRAVYLQVVLHLLLGGIFTTLLAGFWMRSWPARILAGVLYALNGYTWNHFEHDAIINTAAWLPLVLYALERAWRNWTAGAFALAVVSVALLILAGHPQTFYYCLLVAVVTAAFWSLEARAEGKGQGNGKGVWRPALVLAAAIGVALLVCAVQLVPTLELVRLSNRSGRVPYAISVVAGALQPAHLVTLFLPDFFGAIRGPYVGPGDISQSSIYFGVLPLLLAGFVAAGRPGRRGLYLAAMAIVAALISLGKPGLVGSLFYYVVPGFGSFRSLSNFAFVFMLFAALLAGRGLEILERNEFKIPRYLAYLAALGVALGLLLAFVTHADVRVRANIERSAIVLCLGLLAVVVIAGLRRAGVLADRVTGWLVVGLTCVELLVVGAGAITLGQRRGEAALCEERPSPIVTAAGGLPGEGCRRPEPPPIDPQRAAGGYRLHVDAIVYREGIPTTAVGQLGRLGYDRLALHELYSTDGWDPIVLKRHVNFHLLVQRLSGASQGKPNNERIAALARPLAAANVKHLLLQGSLVQVPDPVPRAYFVEHAVPAADEAAALSLIGDPTTDLASLVVVEGAGDMAPPAEPPRRFLPVRFLAYETAQVTVSVDAPRPGFVVFSDTNYPGWEATVNGREAPVLRANHSFKAVRVDAGRSDVRFRFRPRSLAIGAALSAVTVLLAGGLWLAARFRRRREPPRAGPNE